MRAAATLGDVATAAGRRRLRHRVVTVICLLSVLGASTVVGNHPSTVTLTLVGAAAPLVYLLARPGSVSEVEYGLILAWSIASTSVAVEINNGRGHVSLLALSLIPTIALGAAFAERFITWTAVTAAASVAVLIGAARTPPDVRLAVGEPGLAVIVSVCLALIIRVLRSTSVRALALARAAELTDPLTGLSNRRGMEQAVVQGWPPAPPSPTDQQPTSVMLIDIDHFKQINDSRGHAAGDEVLREVGAAISGCLRASDLAVRLGGEEFLVLCPADAEEALEIAERIRRTVAIAVPPVTVSVGVHCEPTLDRAYPVEALHRATEIADLAMYRAKQQGRNRVVLAD